MLQAVPKVITQAFTGSFIKKISQYLHDCVREEVKSSTFRNLKGDKDNKWVFLDGSEKLFTEFDKPLMLNGADSLLTELMVQSDMSQREKYLIYGFLFLVGKNGKSRKNNEFLTPLLYIPCKLERTGKNIKLTAEDDTLSLNTGALAQLIKKDEEEEVDALLSGLLETVPELPLNEDSLEIFLTTLKSVVPDIEISTTPAALENNAREEFARQADEFYSNTVENLEELDEIDFDAVETMKQKPKVKVEKLELERKQAVILTKRPTVTAGVLHELLQISEKPFGTIKETALGVIQDEYMQTKGKQIPLKEPEIKEFFPVTPLSLSDSQEDVIRKIEEHDFLAVYGPPGTGKSQTIVNLVSHLIANGKTVLVASRMDKAVDVVADRLNELGAPYLALRAGRANYQKQLTFKLEDLLSNKVDLDSDYTDAVLVDVPDMKALLDEIKRLENAAEKIIKLEEKFTQTTLEAKDTLEAIGQMRYISSDLSLNEIKDLRETLQKLEKEANSGKGGLFSNISSNMKINKIKNMLNYKNPVKLRDLTVRLPYELDCEELKARLSSIEDEIMKTGNLHQILKKINALKGKQRRLAVDILKNRRRRALKDLLCDQKKRQRLIVHSKSLVSRKKVLQDRLLEKEDFKPLLNAFPCWCTTTYAIANSLPLKPGLFDVVIIDEASQCDIASCFPVLYRSKKAVIVGDDKQLPHLSFLEKAKEQSFLNQYGIDDKYQLMWRFRTNSMFDLANYYSASPVLLDEHFRSSRPIIEFSSKEFYGGRIKIMRPYFDTKCPIELEYIKDGAVDAEITRNMAESEAIIKKLQDIIIEDSKNNPEIPVNIGIISPFRGQVELIKKDIMKTFSGEIIQRHQIEVGTAHTFQGDERDIILMSWAIAENAHSQSLTFLQKPNLFNVAITRARKRMINFISKDPNTLPDGILRDYFEYIHYSNKTFETRDMAKFKNDFEESIFLEQKKLEPSVKAGIECGGVNIDILLNKLVIECDGVEDKTVSRFCNMKKQAILERCGFRVIRVTKREWDLSKNACLDRIMGEYSKIK